MKTYEETIGFESSKMLKNYFDEEMAGGRGKVSVPTPVAETVAFIYEKTFLQSRSDILHLFERKLQDLKLKWDDALNGTYEFFYYYKEDKIFF